MCCKAKAIGRLMLKPAFMRGIGLLEKFRFSYDILIYHDQLKYIPEFVSAFPHQKFVIDHIAKPQIKDGIIHQWKRYGGAGLF